MNDFRYPKIGDNVIDYSSTFHGPRKGVVINIIDIAQVAIKQDERLWIAPTKFVEVTDDDIEPEKTQPKDY